MDTLMPCVDMRGIGRVSYMNPTFWGVLGPGFLIQVPNAYPISTVGFGRIVDSEKRGVCVYVSLSFRTPLASYGSLKPKQ